MSTHCVDFTQKFMLAYFLSINRVSLCCGWLQKSVVILLLVYYNAFLTQFPFPKQVNGGVLQSYKRQQSEACQQPAGIKEFVQHTCPLIAGAWRLVIMVSNDFEGCGNSFKNNTGSIFRWRGRSWTVVWMPGERTRGPPGQIWEACGKNSVWVSVFFCPHSFFFSFHSSTALRIDNWKDICVCINK